jgi:hypothetical protein
MAVPASLKIAAREPWLSQNMDSLWLAQIWPYSAPG